MVQRSVFNKGVNLSYTILPGRSPVLFFIHGTGSNRSIFNQYLKDFKSHKRVALDLRGHGRSQRGWISIKDLVDDCKTLIKKEKLNKIIIIGNSTGSVVALHLAKSIPKKVKGLVLASHFGRPYVRGAFIIRIVSSFIARFVSLFGSNRKLFFQDFWKHRDMSWWQFIFLDIKGTSYTAWFSTVSKSLAVDSNISKINVPTLILQGKRDLLLKASKLRSDSKTIKASFKEIDTHHHVLTDEYDYSLRLIREFLKGIKNG